MKKVLLPLTNFKLLAEKDSSRDTKGGIKKHQKNAGRCGPPE
jgi:hypothetical protein